MRHASQLDKYAHKGQPQQTKPPTPPAPEEEMPDIPYQTYASYQGFTSNTGGIIIARRPMQAQEEPSISEFEGMPSQTGGN